MKKSALRLFAVLAASGLALVSPQAKATSVSSTIVELNGAVTQGDNLNQELSTSDPAELSVLPGYDFSANFSSLTSIMFIQVTLTVQDGNSSATDGQGFDFGHLFLGLDGINTGLALNGFRGNGLEDTLTFSGTVSAAVGAAIFTNLQDGFLLGTIITDNPGDTALSPNDLFIGNDTLTATTTLTLSDVPEPTTVVLIGAGLLLVLAPQVRRFRKNY